MAVTVLGYAAQAAGTPLVVQIPTRSVETDGRTIRLSPEYQVVLEFPRPIDLVGGTRTDLFRATVPEAPQDRFLLLDALNSTGTASLNVITGGRVLPLTLRIDPNARSGTRKYVFTDTEPATPVGEAGPAARTVQPNITPLPTGANAHDAHSDLLAALTRLRQLRAQTVTKDAPLTATLTSERDTDRLVLSVRNAGQSALSLPAAHLRLRVNARRVAVTAEDLTVNPGETRVLTLRADLKLKSGDEARVTWPPEGTTDQAALEAVTRVK